MYIEFTLPVGISGMSGAHALLLIRKDLVTWYLKHNIEYKEKLVKNLLKVTLPKEEDYSFFGLTWEPHSYASRRYKLVEPMARPPK